MCRIDPNIRYYFIKQHRILWDGKEFTYNELVNIDSKWINVFGVPVVMAPKNEVLLWLKKRVMDRMKTVVVTANPEILLFARKDRWFKRIIMRADIITPDGAGVCWAARFFELADQLNSGVEIIKIFVRSLIWAVFGHAEKQGFPERVSGADLLWDIVEMADELCLKVYLLGGLNGTAQRAALNIKKKYPRLQINAFVPDHIATPFSAYELNNEIVQFEPDIFLVAYGSPKQEEWINQNMHRYRSIRLMMGVGGSLDFIAGNTARAPLRLQNHALEWFWRLYKRPSRLIRVVRAVLVFPVFILLSRLKKHYADKFRQ